ncbi:Uncharacterized protein Rs2_02965 [Raphanus sativus]|nr:Uncharacterized protein Rs2_02965 [Raphanus sativus]
MTSLRESPFRLCESICETINTNAEKDEADAKDVGVKNVAEKKVAATPAKTDHLDFLNISPAKRPAYRRGCKVNPKQKDEATQKAEAALKKKEVAELKKKEAKQEVAAKKKEAASKKQKVGEIKKEGVSTPRANVIRVTILTLQDSSIADVTDDIIAAQNEVFPESDVKQEEVAISARIKEYRERHVQLSTHTSTNTENN